MKALLISDLPRSTDDLQPLFSEYKFDLIHYRSPLKALDNIEEISPDMVIINARDFPRHWKPIARHIRWGRSKEEVLITLLTANDFSTEDADKAMFLGIQGIVNFESSNFKTIIEDLRMIFNRYHCGQSKDISKSVQFLFTNPVNETIITGTVKNLTEETLLFLPDTPANVSDLKNNMVLDQCSLKIENTFIFPDCKIISNDNVLNLSFTDLSAEDKKTIKGFLN